MAVESSAVERHLEACWRCKESLWEMQSTLEAIQQQQPRLQRDLAPQIIEKIRLRQQARRRTALCFGMPALLAIAGMFWFALFSCRSEAPSEECPKALPSLPAISGRPEPTSGQGRSDAIAASLRWFTETQEPDGSWDPEKWGGKKQYTVALTGLVLLSFLESESGCRESVLRGIAYLLRRQNRDGLFGGEGEDALYGHGIAALALLKAYRKFPGRDAWKEPITRAVDHLCRSQKISGGWREPDHHRDADVSVSLWQLEVLIAAHGQGWSGVSRNMEMAQRWLADRSGHGVGSIFRGSGHSPRFHPGGASPGRRPVLAISGERLSRREADFYLRCFEGMSLPSAPADRERWSDRSVRELTERQVRSGPYHGTWEPEGSWGEAGGRLCATALAVILLQFL
jgi:hypothetical protein